MYVCIYIYIAEASLALSIYIYIYIYVHVLFRVGISDTAAIKKSYIRRHRHSGRTKKRAMKTTRGIVRGILHTINDVDVERIFTRFVSSYLSSPSTSLFCREYAATSLYRGSQCDSCYDAWYTIPCTVCSVSASCGNGYCCQIQDPDVYWAVNEATTYFATFVDRHSRQKDRRKRCRMRKKKRLIEGVFPQHLADIVHAYGYSAPVGTR